MTSAATTHHRSHGTCSLACLHALALALAVLRRARDDLVQTGKVLGCPAWQVPPPDRLSRFMMLNLAISIFAYDVVETGQGACVRFFTRPFRDARRIDDTGTDESESTCSVHTR